jgi:nucleotide-binding universal stress UspA family protein
VICAVDDSPSALPVLMTARWLADALAAELIVVHAVSAPTRDVQLLPTIRAWLPESDPQIVVLEGSASGSILEAAEEQEATLVVVGARGRGPVRSALLGSVSREVAAAASCPVVVVPPTAGDVAHGSAVDGRERFIVCGIDNSDLSMAAVGFTGRLAPRLGCRPVVVHARQNLRSMIAYRHPSPSTPPLTGQDDAVARQVEDTIKRAAQLAGGDAIEVVEPGAPVEVLKAVADRYDAELIVIAAGGRSALSSALLGSVAAELPVAAARPVVVIPKSVAERYAAS